jgi:hypothetical protein
LAIDTLQEIRIKPLRDVIDAESDFTLKARDQPLKDILNLLSNGGTVQQLLARSRHIRY